MSRIQPISNQIAEVTGHVTRSSQWHGRSFALPSRRVALLAWVICASVVVVVAGYALIKLISCLLDEDKKTLILLLKKTKE